MIELDCRPWNKRNLNTMLRDSTPSEALGYLYIPLGKAANTEIKRQLWDLEIRAGSDLPLPEDYFGVHNYKWVGKVEEWNTPWESYEPEDIDRLVADLMNKFVFTVVRNPYAKLLSGYLDKICRLQSQVASGAPGRKLNNFSLPDVPGSFAEFVDMVCAQSDKETDLHWSGQTYKTLYHFVRYSHVGHFEDLPAVFARISERFAATGRERSNEASHRTSASQKIREHYTDAIAEKVHARYREDFEVFGYGADPFAESLAPVRPAIASGEYSDFCRPLSRVVKHIQASERRKARQAFQRVAEKAAKVNRRLLLDDSLAAFAKQA